MNWHPYLWHPIFVHFTVALLTAGTLFHAIAWTSRSDWRRRFAIAGELNLWLGVILTVVTAATGWLAFETVPHDDDAVHGLMEQHRNLGLGTLGLFAVLALVSAWHRRHAAYPSAPFVAGLILSLAAVGATGLRGGELVYEHGLAVTRASASVVAETAAAPAQPGQGKAPESAPAGEKPAADHSSHTHHHHADK